MTFAIVGAEMQGFNKPGQPMLSEKRKQKRKEKDQVGKQDKNRAGESWSPRSAWRTKYRRNKCGGLRAGCGVENIHKLDCHFSQSHLESGTFSVPSLALRSLPQAWEVPFCPGASSWENGLCMWVGEQLVLHSWRLRCWAHMHPVMRAHL